MTLKTLFTFLFVTLSTAAAAAPKPYAFDYDNSEIGFTYTLNGQTMRGSFPIFDGMLTVDFADVRNSVVNVAIDARKGRAGFVFATGALRGPQVLDTERFPAIRFTSRDAIMSGKSAEIRGDLTVKGITRPATLDVRFQQVAGQPIEARNTLDMIITTQLNRHEFGASGYRSLVDGTLNITIRARIFLLQ